MIKLFHSKVPSWGFKITVAAFMLLNYILSVQAVYTVKNFNSCLTNTCGSYACWKATEEATCNTLITAYKACLAEEQDCITFTSKWTTLQSDTSGTMISYSSCYSACSSKLNNDDYLTYYYKCYAECSDNTQGYIIKAASLGLMILITLVL